MVQIITLEKGFNSTTVDMLEALFSTLGISQAAKSLFTIWVVSPSLSKSGGKDSGDAMSILYLSF